MLWWSDDCRHKEKGEGGLNFWVDYRQLIHPPSSYHSPSFPILSKRGESTKNALPLPSSDVWRWWQIEYGWREREEEEDILGDESGGCWRCGGGFFLFFFSFLCGATDAIIFIQPGKGNKNGKNVVSYFCFNSGGGWFQKYNLCFLWQSGWRIKNVTNHTKAFIERDLSQPFPPSPDRESKARVFFFPNTVRPIRHTQYAPASPRQNTTGRDISGPQTERRASPSFVVGNDLCKSVLTTKRKVCKKKWEEERRGHREIGRKQKKGKDG